MTEPTTEQMLNDLHGKIPSEAHQLLVDSPKWIEAMESRQPRGYLIDNGDGTMTIRKPKRYVFPKGV